MSWAFSPKSIMNFSRGVGEFGKVFLLTAAKRCFFSFRSQLLKPKEPPLCLQIVIPFFSLFIKDIFFFNEGHASRLPDGSVNFEVKLDQKLPSADCPVTNHPCFTPLPQRCCRNGKFGVRLCFHGNHTAGFSS